MNRKVINMFSCAQCTVRYVILSKLFTIRRVIYCTQCTEISAVHCRPCTVRCCDPILSVGLQPPLMGRLREGRLGKNWTWTWNINEGITQPLKIGAHGIFIIKQFPPPLFVVKGLKCRDYYGKIMRQVQFKFE